MTYRPEQARLRAHCLAAVLLILTAAGNYGGGLGMRASLFPALVLPPYRRRHCQLDPLPSWNESASKKAITDFVNRVTRQDGLDFAGLERIATFDNDGTLWSEQPVYFQLAFALDRVKTLAPKIPNGRRRSRSRASSKEISRPWPRRASAGCWRSRRHHAGNTTEEFEKIVTDWIATARHPKSKRLYTDMVFQPMLELLAYLRANGFKTYIVSGGGVEFMRPWTERVYGIPPEQVVGSRAKVSDEVRNGTPVLVRLAEIDHVDDKAGKPVGIHQMIGRRPIAAFGNSDGDFEMLEWVTSRRALASVSSSITPTPSVRPTIAPRTSVSSCAASTRYRSAAGPLLT